MIVRNIPRHFVAPLSESHQQGSCMGTIITIALFAIFYKDFFDCFETYPYPFPKGEASAQHYISQLVTSYITYLCYWWLYRRGGCRITYLPFISGDCG